MVGRCLMERGQRLIAASWLLVAYGLWACSTPKIQAPASTTKQSEKTATISEGGVTTTNIAGDDGSVDSVGAFDKTVHPLTVKWCGACHASAQSPFIGASDAKAAHDAHHRHAEG